MNNAVSPRVAEDLMTYRKHVRPKIPHRMLPLLNTPAEHEWMHDWFKKRGLRVVKSNYTYYDEDSHTLFHHQPENKSSVVASYIPYAGGSVKLARTDHPDERAFEAAMESNLHDRHTRLVYADWLDEQGHSEPAARLRWWANAKAHMENMPEGEKKAYIGGLDHWQKRLAAVHRLIPHVEAVSNRFKWKPHVHATIASAERDALGLESHADWDKNRQLLEPYTSRGRKNAWQTAQPDNAPQRLIFAALHVHRAQHPEMSTGSMSSGLGGELDSAHNWVGTHAEHNKTQAIHEAPLLDYVSRHGNPEKHARNEMQSVGAGGANRQLHSANHDARVELAKTILTEAGITGARVRAVLSQTGKQGIRPAVSAILSSSHPAVAKYAAAYIGLLTGQPRVTVFHPGDGEDVLHVIDSPHPSDHVGEYLSRAGVPAFSMESRGSGTRAFVVNPMNLIDVQTAARGLQGTVRSVPGTAIRLGAGSAKDARAAYRTVIADAEREAGGSKEQPTRLAAIEPPGSSGSVLVRVPTPTPVPSTPQAAPAQPVEPKKPRAPTSGPVFVLPQ